MLRLDINKDIVKELLAMNRKHAGQVALKLLSLLANPRPPDVETIKGTRANYLRADMGEYRIIYTIDNDMLRVVLVGKRNDDEIYKELHRKGL